MGDEGASDAVKLYVEREMAKNRHVVVDAVNERLSKMELGLRQHTAETVNALKPQLERIETQATRTNGRVSALELENAREAGAASQEKASKATLWAALGVAAGLGGGVLAALIAHGLGGVG